MKLVYICHPYRSNPAENSHRVNKWLAGNVTYVMYDVVFFAPQIYFAHYLDFDEEVCMQHCIEFLSRCDELWIICDEISQGMQEEIDFAKEHNIPIIRTRMLELDIEL